jgi:hypothetical protein
MAATSECAFIAGHFDGHADALKQCTWHCPMQHVQGYTSRSHWMLSLSNYSLHIAPATARATINKTTMKNTPTVLAILLVIAVCRYYTARIAQWRRSWLSLKPLDTANGREFSPIASIGHAEASYLC